MNIIATDENNPSLTTNKPGSRLAEVRQQRGYSIEYVAGKLHLRVRIIELLEADEYHKLPEPVFIKGYLRAYAKLLDIPFSPMLEQFNEIYSVEQKTERTLWQSRRETHRSEQAIRWVTGLFALGVIVAVTMWWQKNKDSETLFSTHFSKMQSSQQKTVESNIRLTDLSKMRSLLASPYDGATIDMKEGEKEGA